MPPSSLSSLSHGWPTVPGLPRTVPVSLPFGRKLSRRHLRPRCIPSVTGRISVPLSRHELLELLHPEIQYVPRFRTNGYSDRVRTWPALLGLGFPEIGWRRFAATLSNGDLVIYVREADMSNPEQQLVVELRVLDDFVKDLDRRGRKTSTNRIIIVTRSHHFTAHRPKERPHITLKLMDATLLKRDWARGMIRASYHVFSKDDDPSKGYQDFRSRGAGRGRRLIKDMLSGLSANDFKGSLVDGHLVKSQPPSFAPRCLGAPNQATKDRKRSRNSPIRAHVWLHHKLVTYLRSILSSHQSSHNSLKRTKKKPRKSIKRLSTAMEESIECLRTCLEHFETSRDNLHRLWGAKELQIDQMAVSTLHAARVQSRHAPGAIQELAAEACNARYSSLRMKTNLIRQTQRLHEGTKASLPTLTPPVQAATTVHRTLQRPGRDEDAKTAVPSCSKVFGLVRHPKKALVTARRASIKKHTQRAELSLKGAERPRNKKKMSQSDRFDSERSEIDQALAQLASIVFAGEGQQSVP